MEENIGVDIRQRLHGAMATLAKENSTHRHSDRCMKLIKHLLTTGEKAILECKQSYLHSLAPDRVIITTRRIIVVRPSFWGLYTDHDMISPTEYSIIPYKHLISVIISKGRFLSTIHMRIHGFTDSTSSFRDEGEIYGIQTSEALKLAKFLEEVIEDIQEEEGKMPAQNQKKDAHIHHEYKSESMVNLEQSFNLIDNGAKFVWLGVEPLGYVSTILGVGKDSVIKVSTTEITEADSSELQKYRNCIFVCYHGTTGDRVASFLKKNHNITAYVLEGGITEVAHEYFNRIN